ncbi:MAG: UDP-glucose 4-epimerase GalE [Planctomycetales bacterium]|nr:UDP-glucose 4-epimerase GalE [Planctomycetales bacterium]
MNVLVTGGAGYIGSHAVRQLVAAGHRVTVVDNLVRGHRTTVPPHVEFHRLDVCDTASLADVLRRSQSECVLHFAALAYVGESVTDPLRYYLNNATGTISLLDAMRQANVKRIVFSSTCATYGDPPELPIVETMPQAPINPYGRTKLLAEWVLRDQLAADPEFAFVALRYFNVAGCALDGSVGEDHSPETHLIPIVLQAALGLRDGVTVFGTDYSTPDGTCIRDYIHVEDLCAAHLIAMNSLSPGKAQFYNLGIGRGYSVREVIESARKVTGRAIPIRFGERRPGDPAALFASADKISQELGWAPSITSLDEIVASAWRWFEAHPRGYGDTR